SNVWPKWIFDIANELSKALVIAAWIGIIVALALKTKLAKDVFEASLGYFLPEDLKPELKWIYDQQLLCVESKQDYLIKYSPNKDGVEIQSSSYRRYKNYSPKKVKFDWQIAFDL